MTDPGLAALLSPTSVAVLGASDDPGSYGGRPLRYLRELGYAGTVLPVGEGTTIQGVAAHPSLADLPVVPDVALLTVRGAAVAEAVAECGRLGVPAAVVFASGLGELDEDHLRATMTEAAAAGTRLVGPNAQAVANFATGAVLTPWGVSDEEPPADGPVAVISQSGAMVSMIYGVLRRRGIGVRYAHGIGAAVDVSVAELTAAVLTDPDVRLVLLYLEDLSDPAALEQAAALAAHRSVPVVALTGGRSSAGQQAARSHSGALANEQRVVDAFFRRAGIRRATTTTELLAAAELYLGARPRGRRLAVVSNSGATCVLAADAADDHGLPLARLTADTRDRLAEHLPPTTMRTNPVDVMGLPMADPGLLAKVLAPLADDPGVDVCLLGLPVAGPAYDVERFVADAAGFSTACGKPLLAAVPQPDIRAAFRRAGVPAFDEEAAALTALAQVLDHRDAMRAARTRSARPTAWHRAGLRRPLDEDASLALLAAIGVPVVNRVRCADAAAAGRAFAELGARAVVVKGCTAEVTHKSDLGLVRLGLTGRAEVESAAAQVLAALADHGVHDGGVLVAPMVHGTHEVLLGGHVDPTFGPVVVLGDGGRHVEVRPDVALLLPPFGAAEAEAAVRSLACAPLFDGVRGDPPVDVTGWVDAAVRLGRALTEPGSRLLEVDANPLLLGGEAGRGVVVDAVVVTTDG